MRLRRIPGTKEALAKYPDLVLANAVKYKGEWNNQIFENSNPIALEIGMGRGQFLKSLLPLNPNMNFVGFEKFEEIVHEAVIKIGTGYPNFAIIIDNASIINEYFAPGEVDRIYLNFSDPWPKKKHHKRRLTHENFLKHYKEILKEDGEIFLRTDVRDLFEFSLASLSQSDFIINEVSLDFHNSPYFDDIMTEYEAKKSKLGPIFYAHFTKR